ncbi:hypothetical protein [Weissella paramesenteroides]|uniref:hypothetical protein n=1 Tax=Weissella paramesenteroides TaxID=1249 RepID=UPI00123936AA|nr:hypothetical protein [Weissella paramesenteroides]KAA8446973.1 hypothetical protein FKV72_04040 [Weissella paramesenteroides]KAA8450609.1 hypothetical protein FKV71_08730 [Weissella paramesenteroides]
MKILGWVIFGLGLLLLVGAFGNMKEQSKKDTFLMTIVGLVFIAIGLPMGMHHKNDVQATHHSAKTSSVKKSSSSSASSSIKIDDTLLNSFKSNLSNGNTNAFINDYIKLDMKTQSAYYQKFRLVSPVIISGQVFKVNSNQSHMYLYVNNNDPSAVYLDRENSYDGLEEQGQLHNVFIVKGEPGAFANVQLMSNAKVQGTLGATNIYQKDKMDMPFDLNDASVVQ